MKQKPYPDYKPSGVEWLGDVPSHWEVKRIRHLAMLRSGDSITSASIEPEGEYPVYGGNGLRGFTGGYTHDGYYALIGRQGALCGNINYAKGRFWASEHAVVVHPLVPFEPFWMGELLRIMNLNQYSVSAAQPGLAVDAIAALQIPVPPPDEQTAIADFLDRETTQIDRLVAKKRELIGKLKEERVALISRTVTRGLNPDVRLKTSGVEWLGDVPEGWNIKKLGYGARLQGGYAFAADKFDTEGVPVVRMNNLRRGILDLSSAGCIEPKDCVSDFALEVGDLLWGMFGSVGPTGSLGNFARVRAQDLPAQLNQRVGRFRPQKNGLCNDYLMYVIQTSLFYDQILLKTTGTAQFNVSAEQIESAQVPFPSPAEQRAIADFLDRETSKIDRLAAKVEEAIGRLQEYRAALITAAVTGKVDAREMACVNEPLAYPEPQPELRMVAEGATLCLTLTDQTLKR